MHRCVNKNVICFDNGNVILFSILYHRPKKYFHLKHHAILNIDLVQGMFPIFNKISLFTNHDLIEWIDIFYEHIIICMLSFNLIRSGLDRYRSEWFINSQLSIVCIDRLKHCSGVRLVWSISIVWALSKIMHQLNGLGWPFLGHIQW
jgi:hypothetical protein